MAFSGTNSKHQIIAAQLLSLFYSIFIVYQVCLLLPELFPALKVLPPIPTNIVDGLEESIAPEGLERLRFSVSLLLLPTLILLFNLFFLKLFRWLGYSLSFVAKLLSFGALITVFYIAWKGLQAVDFFYLANSYLYQKPLIYGILFSVMIVVIYLYEIKFENTWKKSCDRWVRLIFTGVTVALILPTFFFCIYSFASSEAYESDEHIDATLNSVAQVMAGKPELISSNGQYGLYGQLLEPIFRIIGFGMGSFTILMGILLALSYLFMFMVLNGTVKNKLIGYFGFTQMFFINFYLTSYTIAEPYYQYQPIRLVFPALMLLITWFYFFKKKSKHLYYGSFVAGSIGILWNLDTGVVLYGAWVAVLAFHEFFQSDFKAAVKKSFFHVITAFIILATVIGLYYITDFVRYGAFPDFAKYIRYPQFFYEKGFFCLPMPLVHPWNIVALIYLIGLTTSIKNLILKQDSPETKLIFFLSILGAGIFSYYQGRSHDLNLTHICYPAFMILTIYADKLLTRVRGGFQTKKYEIQKAILLLGILFFFLSSYFDIFGSPLFNPIIGDRVKMAADNKLKNGTTQNLELIKRHTKPGERILILSYRSAPYYAESHTGCSVDIPSITELLFLSDHHKLMDYLKNNQNPNDKIFLVSNFDLYVYYQDVMDVIDERYQEVDHSDGDMRLYVKKSSLGKLAK